MKKPDRSYFVKPTSSAGKKIYLHEWNESEKNVVLFVHGFPGCGEQACLITSTPLLKSFRLIAIDRPGYGKSENQLGLTPMKLAQQLVEILDEMGIDRIRILSVSGGAPFSLALALLLKDRVVKLSSIGGVAPLTPKNFRYMSSQQKKAWLFVMLVPYPLANKILNRFWQKGLDEIDEFLFTKTGLEGGVDDAVFSHPEISSILSETLKSALQQGPKAVLRDLKIYAKYWGFKMEQIDCPITLWHGTLDDVVHYTYASEMQLRLKNANLKMIPNEGHYSLPMNFRDQIIGDLLMID